MLSYQLLCLTFHLFCCIFNRLVDGSYRAVAVLEKLEPQVNAQCSLPLQLFLPRLMPMRAAPFATPARRLPDSAKI